MDQKADNTEAAHPPGAAVDGAPKAKILPSAWPLSIASILFTIIAIRGFVQYSFVHWKVLVNDGHRIGLELSEAAKDQFWNLLGDLELIRAISGIGALAFALLALRARPRWIAFLATAISVAGLIAGLMVM